MKTPTRLLLVLLCSGCFISPDALSGSRPEQRFYFEMTSANAAWGRQHHGVYIDRHGDVYTYDHRHARWDPADPSAYTEDELVQKFERTTAFIGTVDAITFRHMVALIDAAATGERSTPVTPCNDAGITSYVAYQFDVDRNTYLPVLLYQVGDWAQQNLSREVQTLYEWLFTFEGWHPEACVP